MKDLMEIIPVLHFIAPVLHSGRGISGIGFFMGICSAFQCPQTIAHAHIGVVRKSVVAVAAHFKNGGATLFPQKKSISDYFLI